MSGERRDTEITAAAAASCCRLPSFCSSTIISVAGDYLYPIYDRLTFTALGISWGRPSLGQRRKKDFFLCRFSSSFFFSFSFEVDLHYLFQFHLRIDLVHNYWYSPYSDFHFYSVFKKFKLCWFNDSSFLVLHVICFLSSSVHTLIWRLSVDKLYPNQIYTYRTSEFSLIF